MRMIKLLSVCLLLPALTQAALVIQNSDLELWTAGMPDNWARGNVTIATSTQLNGSTSALLTAVADNQSSQHYFRQISTEPVSGYFYISFDIAFEDAPTGRDINLNIQNASGSSYGSVMNLRYEGGSISLYNGSAWVAVDSSGVMTASDFNSDVINPYRIVLEGTFLSEYTLAITDLNTGTVVLEKTGLNHYQSRSFTSFNTFNFDLSRGATRILVDNLEVYSQQNPFLPVVDLGFNAIVALPDNTMTMAPVVTNTDTPREELTALWTQVGGPAINFSSNPGETQNDLDAGIIFIGGRGEYVLKLMVTDQDGKAGEDSITIRVKDPSLDDKLLGHWGFEDDPQETLAADMLDGDAGNTVADNGYLAELDVNDPNAMPQWIDGWVDSGALQFLGNGIVDVNDVLIQEPNFADLQWEITVAGWIKTDPEITGYQTLIGRSNPFDWVLRKGEGRDSAEFVVSVDGTAMWAIGTTSIQDGYWHHLAGTFNGAEIVLYVDGVEDARLAAEGLITESLASRIAIGNRRDMSNHRLRGSADDIRVYSYALTPDQIAGLVQMGVNAIPRVAIDPEIPTDLIIQFEDTVDLNAVVMDINLDDTIGAVWSVADPEQAANVTFGNANAIATTATFLQSGVYTLRLTVNDGTAGLDGDIYDEVVIALNEAVCEDLLVFNDVTGRYLNPTLSADLTGPEGMPDCAVNLYDLAVMATQWLLCNDPEGEACIQLP